MSLLFPAYLIGLAGLFLPWLLHRFSDQQPEEQLFPSRQFLEPTAPPVSRKRALKHWLLLALRVLSILLLSFLFAQPWLSKTVDNAQADVHHLISIDQSLSMRADGRWARAVERADALIGELPDSDTIELVAFARDVNRIADDSESVNTLRFALKALEPLYTSADYGVMMQRLNQVAGEYSQPVKVWLISDQQQSSLPAQLNALYAPEVSLWDQYSVVQDAQENVHLSASAQSDDGANVRVSVQLRASSAQPDSSDSAQENALTTHTIQVRSDDQLLVEETLSMQSGDVISRVFDDLVIPPGENPVLRVSLLEVDALSEDNEVSLTIDQTNPTPVVLLQSERTSQDGAAVFLTTALETDSLASVQAIAGTAERVPPETVHILAAQDLTLPSIALDVLQFVDTDANAMVFDDSISESTSNVDIQGVGVGLVDESHPLGLGQIDWFGARFYDVGAMMLQEDDRVLLETDDRQPLLVERSTQRGTLLLLNDRLDGLSSNLPLQPAFVSLMQAVLAYFDASTAIPDQLIAGSRLSLPANVQLFDPDNKPLLALADNARIGGIALDRPGLYKVVSARGEQSLRVLLDSGETDLSLISGDAMEAWNARYEDAEIATSNEETNDLPVDPLLVMQGDDVNRYSLWFWLLPLLVMAMLTESVFANRRLDVRRDGS